jgi:hypothetical protein
MGKRFGAKASRGFAGMFEASKLCLDFGGIVQCWFGRSDIQVGLVAGSGSRGVFEGNNLCAGNIYGKERGHGFGFHEPFVDLETPTSHNVVVALYCV